MAYFGRLYLDREKDMIVDLDMRDGRMYYTLSTPNHSTGNLITNFAKVCELPLSYNSEGLKIIEGEVPCYINAYDQQLYILRFGNTKVASIYPDGRIEMKASIPSIAKTLMSQTKDYNLSVAKTIIKQYILNDCKFRTDLHAHMNANLDPDILMALGIFHQIEYPLYYIKKLDLRCSAEQERMLSERRAEAEKQFSDSPLKGKYLTRKIDDNTFINFADLILGNLADAEYNIPKIRASLTVLKDGQAVFSNLEKVYLYRYVFTKAKKAPYSVDIGNYGEIPDSDIVRTIRRILADRENERYRNNSLFQDKLLWIARSYEKQGIEYVEISDTTLVKKTESVKMLQEVHEVMPYIREETGVTIRFLAAIRRIPLTIVKDNVTPSDYLQEAIQVLKATATDPYVAGSDMVGEEINDILELKPVIEELVKIAQKNEAFVIRVHAGESDCLQENVENSIKLVREAAGDGPMPIVRIGHGIHTPNLRTPKGKELLNVILQNNVVLEFQITSNVRLNNLTSLKNHPLKQYLAAGVKCVQGTDGCALYGTTSIDEQLSLEKLLDLEFEDQMKMRRTEDEIIGYSMKAFRDKEALFDKARDGRTVEEYMTGLIAEQTVPEGVMFLNDSDLDSSDELADRISPLPDGMYPVIIVGGSFNNSTHSTVVGKAGKNIIDQLLREGDPEKMYFVIGHKLLGYERYLMDRNKGRFRVFAIVPSMISSQDRARLKRKDLEIRVSIEPSGMGLYKSFAYEIFRNMKSTLIAFDGNSAAANMVQEAKNGRMKCDIYVYERCRLLKMKARSLLGYVKLFDDYDIDIGDMILKNIE
ncbi:MAG: adenosine deaminase [Oscillospiraceae bacterium]|nr:adenosine deaminase [Oscillospiraceae bacterium]